MIKRLDLFMPPNISQYGVLHHFTQKMYEALLRTGVNCRILEAKRDNPKPFLTELFKDPPECTLSFNGLLPDEEGRFFCDLIHIPHIAYVVDSPNGFVSLVHSPYTIITSADRNGCEFFKGVNAKNVLFMPHGVEKNLNFDPRDEERTYDVLMLSSCIDYENMRKQWSKKYSPEICTILDEAAEIVFSDQTTSYVQAFVSAMDANVNRGVAIDSSKVDFIDLLDELEIYARGKDRVELVRAIKDAKVDIFGSPASTTTWKKQLGGQSNVVIHDEVPYDQALELMQKSKIVLNSCAWIKYGLHERILAALACGALPITAENPFIKESFKEGSNIAFYRYNDRKEVNNTVNEYLKNESKRRQVAAAGREIVMHHHTWDQRASALIKEISPILNTLRGSSRIS